MSGQRPHDRCEEEGWQVPPIGWDRVRPDGLGDDRTDLVIGEASAMAVHRFADGCGKKDALRHPRVAGVALAYESIGREGNVQSHDSARRRDWSRRREVTRRRTLRIASDGDACGAHDLFDRPQPRQDDRRSASEVIPAVGACDRDIRPHPIGGRETVRERAVDDRAAHRVRDDVYA